MGTSPNRSYPYPAGSDAVDVPGDMEALADAVDTDVAAVIAYDTAYVSKSSAYTLVGTDRVIDVTGTTTITLPAAASHTGRVYVVRNTGSNTVTVSGVTGLTLPGKGTATVVSDGSAWSLIDGTYTDESVGRRIFTWDAVNARWQMTYGDTGWRNVTADLLNGWTSSLVAVRRVNETVYLRSSNGSGASATSGLLYVLPVSFRPTSTFYDTQPINSTTSVSSLAVSSTTGNVVLSDESSHTDLRMQKSWSTTQAWPTSLPGTASGSIPS